MENVPHQNSHRILIAPLDWGLGHATRCIPIIQSLINHGIVVYIAAEGRIKDLLNSEFPQATFLSLPPYNIRYSRTARTLPLIILKQLPKITKRIWQEHRWLQRMIKIHKLDAVISDNRFGLFTKKIPCIYLTHQLTVLTGNNLSDKIATRLHRLIINKYNRCWIPDAEINDLAGRLSHPEIKMQNAQYIGPLSRLTHFDAEKKHDWFISLSGPEPQRTIFEEKIFSELHFLKGNILIVLGLPGESSSRQLDAHVTVYNHLSATQYNQAIAMSDRIICRSGYTSLMDLTKLKKKALLIPTPGQAEQEYLAQYSTERNLFPSVVQKSFSLKNAIQLMDDFDYQYPDFVMDQYKNVIGEFVASLKLGNFATQ